MGTLATLVVLVAAALVTDSVAGSCVTDGDCNGKSHLWGFKCVSNHCVSRKPCPRLQTDAPPEGCYYKLRPNTDGCLITTLKCDQKKVEKREIPECPKSSAYLNCTDICGYPHCATMNHVRHCHSLRCGPPACVCKRGHIFISADHSLGCVQKEECSKIVHKRHTEKHLHHHSTDAHCGLNEHFTYCGTACEPSCASPEPRLCTMQCIVGVCQCNEGYYRHETKGCVPRSQCS